MCVVHRLHAVLFYVIENKFPNNIKKRYMHIHVSFSTFNNYSIEVFIKGTLYTQK